MKIYWSLANVPELSHLSAKEKKILWEKASTKIFRHLHGWLGLIACGLCASIGSTIGQFFDFGSLGAAVGGGIGGFIYSQVIFHFAVKNYIDILVDKHSLQKRNTDA